jgi:hypothetical protein
MTKFEANDDERAEETTFERDPCCDCQGFWYVCSKTNVDQTCKRILVPPLVGSCHDSAAV